MQTKEEKAAQKHEYYLANKYAHIEQAKTWKENNKERADELQRKADAKRRGFPKTAGQILNELKQGLRVA